MTAILFAEMTPEAAWEDRFNTWYDHDHIRSRMEIEGFTGAQRYRATDTDNYLVVYDMQSLAILKTPAYEHLKNNESDETLWMLANVRNFTRNLGVEIGRDGFDETARDTDLIFVTMFDVPSEHLDEFDAWMKQDHAPLLLRNKEWLAIRRFSMTFTDPQRFTRLNIHYLASPAALESPERTEARGTPWRAAMAEKHAWFRQPRTATFRRFGPFFGPVGKS